MKNILTPHRQALYMQRYWVYILECSDGTLYTGYTSDVNRRLHEHNSGRASKYTRSRLPVNLRYFERAKNRSVALKREYEIKRLSRSEKLLLCALLRQS
jgi:putative endonuclease